MRFSTYGKEEVILGARTVTKADFEIIVKTGESEEKISRVWKKTREQCPVGILFEQAGVQVDYELNVVKE